MITSRIPISWKDLQNRVANILDECGYEVEIEKTIQTARSQVEIDVFAIEKVDARSSLLLVECKNWNSNVPQSVVSNFRTIMADVGANYGIIVSKKGFQSGAYETIRFTNIELFNWIEFQNSFQQKWLKHYFPSYIKEKFDLLVEAMDICPPSWVMRLEGDELQQMRNLHDQYFDFSGLILSMESPFNDIIPSSEILLPLCQTEIGKNFPEDILTVTSYRELIELLHIHLNPVIEEIRRLKFGSIQN